MTHRELRINQHYIARVSGTLVPVRLNGMEMKAHLLFVSEVQVRGKQRNR